ncbi:hypothetical protein SEA_TINYMINY_64 [Microbacterium phage TinyMiny]|nr:hypothetical protein SEA_TINYMINY_64 [Microbacterium phage TinyMiny]
MYTITYARGTSVQDEVHYQRKNVPAARLSKMIIDFQRRGERIVRVEEQA